MLETATMIGRLTFFATLATACLVAAGATFAQSRLAQSRPLPFATPGASAWEVVKGGRLRLVTTPPAPDGTAQAALEIELEPGFKTYWWNPGPDGIPPQVSFFGSANVTDAKLKLPPPHVFREAGVTVGYRGSVSFPIQLATEAPQAPYRLVASGVLGFCADVCVPVPFRFEATSPARMTARGIAVSAGGNVVEPSDHLRVENARYDAATGRLEVEATVPDTDVLLEMVVADPGGMALPPAASAVHQEGDQASFVFELPAKKTKLPEGHHLTFALIVGQFGQKGRIAIEQTLPVERID